MLFYYRFLREKNYNNLLILILVLILGIIGYQPKSALAQEASESKKSEIRLSQVSTVADK